MHVLFLCCAVVQAFFLLFRCSRRALPCHLCCLGSVHLCPLCIPRSWLRLCSICVFCSRVVRAFIVSHLYFIVPAAFFLVLSLFLDGEHTCLPQVPREAVRLRKRFCVCWHCLLSSSQTCTFAGVDVPGTDVLEPIRGVK